MALERHTRDLDLPGGEEAERVVGKIRTAQALQQLARARARDDEHADVVRQVFKSHGTVFGHALVQPVVVQPLPGSGRNQIESIVGLTGDGEFRMDASALVE